MISLADLPSSAFVFRADGSVGLLIGDPSPENVLPLIEPRGEDPDILELGVLPSGRKFFSSRLAELQDPENALVSSWLGRPVYGNIVVLPSEI